MTERKRTPVTIAFSAELPTEPGLYMRRYLPTSAGDDLLQVRIRNGELVAYWIGCLTPVAEIGGEWCGPLIEGEPSPAVSLPDREELGRVIYEAWEDSGHGCPWEQLSLVERCDFFACADASLACIREHAERWAPAILRPHSKSGMISWPDDWEPRRYNATNEPCDMLVGPCACGASHFANEDWVQEALKTHNAVIGERETAPTPPPSFLAADVAAVEAKMTELRLIYDANIKHERLANHFLTPSPAAVKECLDAWPRLKSALSAPQTVGVPVEVCREFISFVEDHPDIFKYIGCFTTWHMLKHAVEAARRGQQATTGDDKASPSEPTIKSAIRDMCAIICDDSATDDDRKMALNTLVEAIDPSPAIDLEDGWPEVLPDMVVGVPVELCEPVISIARRFYLDHEGMCHVNALSRAVEAARRGEQATRSKWKWCPYCGAASGQNGISCNPDCLRGEQPKTGDELQFTVEPVDNATLNFLQKANPQTAEQAGDTALARVKELEGELDTARKQLAHVKKSRDEAVQIMSDERRDHVAAEQKIRKRMDEYREQLTQVTAERDLLHTAIKAHHAQKADDRCWLDDDKLYEAAGLPAVDRHVGDKNAMLENCKRFLVKRCEPGKWPTYVELEQQLAVERARAEKAEADAASLRVCLQYFKEWGEEVNKLCGYKAMPGAWDKINAALDGTAGSAILAELDDLRCMKSEVDAARISLGKATGFDSSHFALEGFVEQVVDQLADKTKRLEELEELAIALSCSRFKVFVPPSPPAEWFDVNGTEAGLLSYCVNQWRKENASIQSANERLAAELADAKKRLEEAERQNRWWEQQDLDIRRLLDCGPKLSLFMEVRLLMENSASLQSNNDALKKRLAELEAAK